MADADFPAAPEGRIWMTEGGTETEILYRHGHDLPEFAMFPLLDAPDAAADLRAMLANMLDAAAALEQPVLLGGTDYRASPDWGAKLGYSREALAEAILHNLAFLREVSVPYEGQIPEIRLAGLVGPRGDAYGTGGEITAEEAEDYHTPQLETLARGGADLAEAMTFTNIPEAVGLARAARAAGIPLAILFTLSSEGRLRSGPTLREAVETVDRETDAAPAFYGINCAHPEEFAPALDGGDWTARLRCLRPNAAKMDKIALCKLGHIEEGDPDDLAARLADLARRYPAMDVWGGCCGTSGPHLEKIGRAVLAARREAARA